MLMLKQKTGPKPKVSKELAMEFKRLNDMRYSMESIGKTYNCTHATVSRAIKKLLAGGYE